MLRTTRGWGEVQNYAISNENPKWGGGGGAKAPPSLLSFQNVEQEHFLKM